MKIASMRFWENENDYRSLSNEQLQALSAAPTGGPELDTSRWESLVVTGLERENLSFRPQMSVSTRSAYARTAGFSLSRRGACRAARYCGTLNQICSNSDQVDLSVF